MVGAGQEQQGPERKTNRIQALQERRSGSHTRDNVLSGKAGGSCKVGGCLEISRRAPLQGHWLCYR